MYRRPKFLETLLAIRRDMALEADYDVDLFAEMARSGKQPVKRAPKASTDASSNGHSPNPAKRRRVVTK
jgi:hypothetical protein